MFYLISNEELLSLVYEKSFDVSTSEMVAQMLDYAIIKER
ncbi:hypothetical protein RV17_GL001990 [Enterococcus thailandicus]|nr:hypothetical protein RV17_GL001990 [Enterococcus thailandicus]